MIQSLQTDNDQLKGKFSILEKDTTNLTNKTQSMTEGAETVSERIHAVKCINQNLLNSCYRLVDRVPLQEVNIYAIEFMFKDETLSLLDRLHTLES